MKISVFVHTANPSVDQPMCRLSRSEAARLVATGVALMISARAIQYVLDRKGYIEPVRVSELGYDRTVSHGRNLVWVPSGLTWQMKPTYGSMSRHFGQTRGGMNFAPNSTTSPSQHRAGR
jgi:hypothetical protein